MQITSMSVKEIMSEYGMDEASAQQFLDKEIEILAVALAQAAEDNQKRLAAESTPVACL